MNNELSDFAIALARTEQRHRTLMFALLLALTQTLKSRGYLETEDIAAMFDRFRTIVRAEGPEAWAEFEEVAALLEPLFLAPEHPAAPGSGLR